MSKRPAFLIPAVFIALILGGCSGDDISPATPIYPETVISNDVIVIDDDPSLSVYEITDETVVLSRLGGRTLKFDDLIVGSSMGGFVRRVKAVREDDNFLILEAEPRPLTSAVINGYAHMNTQIGPGSAAAIGDDAPVSGAAFNLSGLVLYSGEAESGDRVVIENGSVSFSPEIGIEMAIFGKRIDRLDIRMEGKLGIDLDIFAEITSETFRNDDIRVAALRRPAKMMIGSVPVPVVIELSVHINTAVRGSFTKPLSTGYAGTHDIAAGITWSGVWRTTEQAPVIELQPKEIDMGPLSDGLIGIRLTTELRVSFYSGDAAVIRSEPWVELRSRLVEFPVWRWSMTGAISLWKDFYPVLLDRRLPRYDPGPLYTFDLLDSGPFEAESHIFIREWGGLAQPRGIAIGPGGEVYVADQDNHRIAVFDRLGGFLREWGSYGTAAGSLIFPSGVAVASDGTVFVSDSGNHRVQRFTAEGEFLGMFGGEGTGEGEFVQLEGIAAGADSILAVCDSGTSSFSVFTLDGSFAGRHESVLARVAAFDSSSNIYTSGCHSGGVTMTDRHGSPLGIIGPDICATGLAVGPAGNIYILDYDLDRFAVLGSRGTVISTVGSPGTGPGEFDRPGGIAVTPEGWVYVSDTGNGRIQIFAPK
jgi:hypothetical protein